MALILRKKFLDSLDREPGTNGIGSLARMARKFHGRESGHLHIDEQPCTPAFGGAGPGISAETDPGDTTRKAPFLYDESKIRSVANELAHAEALGDRERYDKILQRHENRMANVAEGCQARMALK